MFCGKCGAKNDDSAVFCAECGNRIQAAAPVAPAAPAANPAPAAAPVATGSKPGFTLNNRNIGIIAVAAVAVIALLISCFFIFGGRSYKDVVKDYFKATEKADAKLMMELLPDDLIKYVMKEEDMTKKEMTEELQDSLDMIHRYYDEVKISYEITDTEDFDKDELKEIKEMYEEIDVKVKDAMIVEVEVTMELDGNERTTTQELTLIKVGGSWYLDIEDVM
jgi:uncharacterized membrane protein YvbJ